MFFWLKKLIGYWIMPVPLCVVVVTIGVVLLWRGKRQKLAHVLVTFGAILLLLLGNKLFSQWLVRPLEHRFPTIGELSVPSERAKLAGCDFVVVLGSGNGFTPGMASINELSTSARARIVEAVRILRVLPEAQLLVSGPGEAKRATHATVLEQSAVSLGIDPGRIQRIEHARDTEDESNAVKKRVGDARVALVTSAFHMPRAAALFASAGVRCVPCPTDYTSHDDGEFHWGDLLWDVESLERSSLAIRERIGWVWISLRGKAGSPAR